MKGEILITDMTTIRHRAVCTLVAF